MRSPKLGSPHEALNVDMCFIGVLAGAGRRSLHTRHRNGKQPAGPPPLGYVAINASGRNNRRALVRGCWSGVPGKVASDTIPIFLPLPSFPYLPSLTMMRFALALFGA